jgi:hypothetical protein
MTQADLSIIPDVVARWQADTDFRIARECRAQARRLIRDRTPGWRFSHRLELRRALRYWSHYAQLVRAYNV